MNRERCRVCVYVGTDVNRFVSRVLFDIIKRMINNPECQLSTYGF